MKLTVMVLPLRALQLFVSLVILGLSGYVANWYNIDTLQASPSQVNFLIFVPVFSIISIVYMEGAPKFFPRIVSPYVVMAVEVLNVLFYFAGAIALGVFLNSLLFCRGTVCGAARADTGLSVVQWLMFTVTAVVNGLDAFKGGMRKPARAGMKGSYPKEMKQSVGA